MSLGEYEDMRSQHKRYQQRGGHQDACKLPGDKDMPRSTASGEEWAAYHASHIGKGGFNPCTWRSAG